MVKPYTLEVASPTSKSLICGNRERLAGRATDKNPFERGANEGRQICCYPVKVGNVARVEGRPEHGPSRPILAQCAAKYFIVFKGGNVVEASSFEPEIHSSTAREKANHGHTIGNCLGGTKLSGRSSAPVQQPGLLVHQIIQFKPASGQEFVDITSIANGTIDQVGLHQI